MVKNNEKKNTEEKKKEKVAKDYQKENKELKLALAKAEKTVLKYKKAYEESMEKLERVRKLNENLQDQVIDSMKANGKQLHSKFDPSVFETLKKSKIIKCT